MPMLWQSISGTPLLLLQRNSKKNYRLRRRSSATAAKRSAPSRPVAPQPPPPPPPLGAPPPAPAGGPVITWADIELVGMPPLAWLALDHDNCAIAPPVFSKYSKTMLAGVPAVRLIIPLHSVGPWLTQ